MLLRILYDDKLAQASYLLGCQACGEALVVDPNRNLDQYISLAKKEGLKIRHVTETHIHADFVSGPLELAQRTGARMYLSGEGGPDWAYGFAADPNATLVHDGDTFMVGNLKIQVMHTPGHTPEHIALLVTDTPVTDQPIGIFSGDFVFVGDVGRPDLLEKAAGIAGTMRDGARDLYRSLQRFRELPDYLQVWPGHGAGSACGKALGAVPQSTVGYEKLFSAAFKFTSEEEFADYILAGQPEPPKYFAHMKRINRDGPPLLGENRMPQKLEDASVGALLAGGTTVVDTRTAIAFGKAHIPGTINIPYNRSFTNWAGSLISYEKPFALIVDERTATQSLRELVRDLSLIGLDDIAGYFTESAVSSHAGTIALPAVTTADIDDLLEDENVQVVDVRGRGEWSEGHMPGVPNIPLAQLADRQTELPRDKRIVLHCQGGGRSAIAASVLQAAGFDVLNVRGGYDEWAKSGRPVERETAAEEVTHGS